MGGRSSGSSAPTETRVTQSDLPEYVQPYFERILQRGEAESNQPYTPYGGERLAYFSPDEMTAQGMTRGYAQSGTPIEYQMASERAAMLGGPYGSGYQADYLGNTYDAQGYDSGYQAGLVGPGYQAGQQREGYDAQTYQPGYQAGLVGSGYQARDLGLGFGAQGLQSGYQAQDNYSTYDPQLRASQYQAAGVGPSYQPLSYEENIDRFMSPYQQNVIDIQKREATRQSEMMGDKTADAATMSGGLGGYREAIMQSERERNLGQQLGDIQATGSQKAFESAQQQLERERASGMGAAQFGLQQFTAGEQARQAQEQMAQQAYQAGETARQKAAEMGMSARQQNQASRQAEEQFRQSAFAQTESSRQAQEKFRQSAYQAGESARQEAAKLGLSAAQQNEAARQAEEKFSQSGFQLTEGSYQKQAEIDLKRYQAGEQAKQAAAKLGLTAAQQNEAARQAQEKYMQSAYATSEKSFQEQGRQDIAAYQAREAARQAQEKYGQSAYDMSQRYGLASVDALRGIGGDIQGDVRQRIAALQGIGSQQRAMQQAGMDMGYQDFLRQQGYSMKQISDMAGLLRGVPVQPNQQISTYSQQPGLFQTAIGAGLQGLGLYRGMS
tara:strand:+ start:3679 stop:5511 length:1833 start_codon:yes stop_codon:yes gene_type:complete